MNSRDHWEKIYETKTPDQCSWTEDIPQTSLEFIHELNLPKTARIIDIGGGDSKLLDHLVAAGYQNITVLDISENAIARARTRLGKKSDSINWVRTDITEFNTTEKFDCWHDRATFHFLTTDEQVEKYLTIARKTIRGYMVLATFSDSGPDKCSGLFIKKYGEADLQNQLSDGFEKIVCKTEDHLTPFGTKQNFIFCSFRRTN